MNRRLLLFALLSSTNQFGAVESNAQDLVECNNLSLIERMETLQPCYLSTWSSLPFRPAEQQDSMWCWAACLQAILEFKNVDFVDQEQIVIRLFGGLANEPAGIDLIAQGIDGYWSDQANPAFRIKCTTRVFYDDETSPNLSPDFSSAVYQAIEFFQDEETRIALGFRLGDNEIGHLVVADSFEIKWIKPNQVVVESIRVLDPLLPPGSSGYRDLTAKELANIKLIFSLQVDVL